MYGVNSKVPTWVIFKVILMRSFLICGLCNFSEKITIAATIYLMDMTTNILREYE
jgi:hypothetical protein